MVAAKNVSKHYQATLQNQMLQNLKCNQNFRRKAQWKSERGVGRKAKKENCHNTQEIVE
jgi:hypothetical protein